MRCVIWYHLYNLENAKNTHEGVLILVVMKRRVMLPLRFAVNFKYSFIHVKTQILSFSRYRGNWILPMWNFLFDVFIVTNADNQKILLKWQVTYINKSQYFFTSFFNKSHNFSEEAFIKCLTTALFLQRSIHIASTLHVSKNYWMFPYFDTISFIKRWYHTPNCI